MKLYVLEDTDISGFVQQGHPTVLSRINALSDEDTVATTIITVGEDLSGWLPACRRAPNGATRARIIDRTHTDWVCSVDHCSRNGSASRNIPLDVEHCRAYRMTEDSISRHRNRSQLSRPIRLALSDNVISDESRLLDYGCGHGDDVDRLSALGVSCIG